jgi:hypothetical protein
MVALLLPFASIYYGFSQQGRARVTEADIEEKKRRIAADLEEKRMRVEANAQIRAAQTRGLRGMAQALIGKGKFNGIFAKVRCSSQMLHELGPDIAISKVYNFLAKLFDECFWLQVGELHLCCDIAGWDLTLEDSRVFVTWGRSKRARLAQDVDEGRVDAGGLDPPTR